MMALFYLFVFLLSFCFMEFMAWFAHKYLMHGVLWFLHEDHHVKEPGFFEKNDAFFMIFAIPSWLFIMFGMMGGMDWRLYFGLGILAYGICYFIVHDVLIHRRFSWFQKVRNPYFQAIIRAHNTHHKNRGKHRGESFGMLFVPKRYYQMSFEKNKKSAKQ